MEKFLLDLDLKTMYVKASSFPDGIKAAHEKLHTIVHHAPGRIYFGISAPDHTGTIQYKAATLELEAGEAEKHKLETFIIKKGRYRCVTISDYNSNPARIGEVFNQLIHSPEIDPEGECVEWYLNENDVRCMVRLVSSR